MSDLALVMQAIEAMKNSYSPYSGFTVGAALLCDDGSVYRGCNIENGAYSATVCAERTALFKAVSDGKRGFAKIAVVGGKSGNVDAPCYPCGVCRQVLSEFCDGTLEILTVNKGDIQKTTLSELLPHAFGL